MFNAMFVCKLSAAETVPPLQMTLPTPVKVLVPLIWPAAISKIAAPPSELVTRLKVTVAPFTRFVPGPVSAKFPLKKKDPPLRSISEPAATVNESLAEVPPPPSVSLPLCTLTLPLLLKAVP